ncbi:MAG: hypothetical protein AAFS10_26690 [Myxococcota bacterium]
MATGYHCHACGYELTLEVKVARRDTCDNCGADLHACVNCKFYDEGADTCRENITRWVRDRERSNFCQSFTFRESSPDRADEIADAKSRLDSLFKNL